MPRRKVREPRRTQQSTASSRSSLRLFYATNRDHLGRDRWHPAGYGSKFSDDGAENLRFGQVFVEVDPDRVQRHLQADCGPMGRGDGEALAAYLTEQAGSARIEAYPERL